MWERLKDGRLTLVEEGVTALQFMKKRIRSLSLNGDDDPFYVADLNDVIEKHWRFLQQLPRVRPFYAVKCNSSIEVLQVFAALGTGFDCASKAEIKMILGMGLPATDIIYANPCKQPSHIRYAAKHGVNRMTFDCESELEKIPENHPDAEMILRIHTDDEGSVSCLSKKFGALVEICEHLLKRAKSLNVLVTGVSFHIGSGSSNPHSFHQCIADARRLFDVGNKLGHKMRVLDIGGGFPGHPDFQPGFEEFSAVIAESLDQYFPSTEDVQIIAEPGTYYMCSAFTCAINIITKKENYVKAADGKDTRKLSYYLNDGLFGSFLFYELYKKEIRLVPVVDKVILPSAERFPSTLWGPCCTEKDMILEEVDLPELEVGDWLIFQNMGAYHISMATVFCGFRPPRVHYILSKDKWMIFERQCSKLSY
ncbi:ornithine decarboxylase-like isoform X1 [Pseudophryne corroboree]|uniref:ornithine decarboxylase-like isoform X1 n=1 Tax=Pseudophryne corroboree TaxID=495146 RepID=UPI00308201B2